MRSRSLLLRRIGLAGLGALLLSGSPAAAEDLSCEALPRLMESYVQHHIRFRELTPQLRQRTAELYLERVDPSRVLLLADEAAALERQIAQVFEDLEDGDCSRLLELQKRVVARYASMESFVRAMLDREGYAVDYETELELDPEERGYPRDAAERDDLYERLVHFQVSNYLEAEEDLAEARKRLVHRYELMHMRAREQSEQDVLALFLDAFASALDPHSNYLSAEALEEFQISMGLSLEGIGVALSSRDGYSVVERIIPGGAAEQLGVLQPNDKIIAVAQEGGEPVDIVDMALRDVVRLIRGEKGTQVHLTILRQGETTERFQVSIVRDTIDLEEQAAKLRFEEVGEGEEKLKLAVLQLPSFYGDNDPRKRRAAADVAKLLREVRREGADGLLLDLSRNGGGLLDHAVRISGYFLRSGGIVAVQDPNIQTKVLRDPDPGILYSGPLVVLVSKISASASEILAGALKDYGRAVIVGDEHTFGKGTVQTVVTLPTGLGAMKVTTGIFYRPGGASTQHRGVASDVVIPSLSNAEEFGEQYQPFALKSRRIPPFLNGDSPGLLQFRGRDAVPPWTPVSPDLLAELAARSTARLAEDTDFAEIRDRIAERKKDRSVIKLSELRDQNGDGEGVPDPTAPGAVPPGEPGSPGADGAPEGEGEERELSAQAREALRILEDLVRLSQPGDDASEVRAANL